jgi:hypothetical protein
MHGDDAGFDAKAAHVDELVRARMRVMGLPKDEIARIEQKSEAVVDEQVNAEIEDFLQRLPKHVARRWRRQWKRGAR